MTDGPARLRLDSRTARLSCAGIVFIVALATYWLTLAPGVALVDSGELIVAAHNLGVAHPPGFPFYIMLAHLATMIPIGSVAVRVNFASALFAALASAVVTLIAAEALLTARLASVRSGKQAPDRKHREKKRADSHRLQTASTPDSGGIGLAACLASGLLLAFSRTLWAYATIAEVYTLNTLLISGIFLLVFHWRRLAISEAAQPRNTKLISKDDRWLNAAAVLFGLGLGVHHVSVGLMLPALAWLVLASQGPAFFLSKRLLRAAMFAFAGLAVYIYLPIAASRSPIMNWGDPQTLQRFWWHITGNQYQIFFTFSSERMGQHLGEFFILFGREFGPWFLAIGLLLALSGAVALFKRDWKAFVFVALVIVCDVVYSISYEIAEDKDAYYLPALVATTITAAFACDWLIRPVPSILRVSAGARNAVASVILLLAPIVALWGNLPFNNRSRYFIAQDYVENILNSVEPGGLVLTRDWQVYSPMMYANEVERRRPDVIAIDIQQLRRSWYYAYLRTVYPDLIEQSRDKVDAFLEDLLRWEQDHDLYQQDASLNQRINTRFYDMIQAFVTNHLRHAPVYVTQDIALNREGEDSELTKWLADTYQPVPQGLVFKLAGKDQQVPQIDVRVVTRGLADGSMKFESGDVVNIKVIPAYLNMLYSRGRYLAALGRHQEAVEVLQQALAIRPNLSAAQQALYESQNAIRKSGVGSGP